MLRRTGEIAVAGAVERRTTDDPETETDSDTDPDPDTDPETGDQKGALPANSLMASMNSGP